MKNWSHTFAEDLWLKPDDVGVDEAAFIKKTLRLRRGQSVLDAPCGAGRIAIHLAHAGCFVTGIDLSQSFINRAKARFRHEKQNGRFFPLDLRDMDFSAEFHGVYSWHGSFGYFSDSENAEVIKKYAAALRPKGRLLIDQPNRQSLLRHFVPSHTVGNLKVRNSWSPEIQRVESDWIVERNGQEERNPISIRLYTYTQMKRLFERSGLTGERTYGSIAGDEYRRSSKRLIMVGRKIS